MKTITRYNKIKRLFLSSMIILNVLFLFFNQNFTIYISNFYDSDNKNNLRDSNYWNLTGSPIYINNLDPNSDWVKISSQNDWCSGSGTINDPYIIENIEINGQNNASCIEIRNSNVYFEIRNCTLYNSELDESGAGISLKNVENAKILNNSCSFNNYNGIYVGESSEIEIKQNILSNNTFNGIRTYFCYEILIQENHINGNEKRGVFSLFCNSTNIINNTVNLNTEFGIELHHCYNNNLSKNYIEKTNQTGYMLIKGRYNYLQYNTISNNYEGIKLESSNHTTIRNNIIMNNIYGIFIIRNSSYNSITYNDLLYNEIHYEKEPGCPGNVFNEETNNIEDVQDIPSTPEEENLLIIVFIIVVIVAIVLSTLFLYFYRKRKRKPTKVVYEPVYHKVSRLDQRTPRIIFLSYSTRDSPYFNIPKIVKELEKYPEIEDVLFWEEDSAANIVEYMDKTLLKCNVFVLFCSENSYRSTSVKDEWQAAFQRRKKGALKIIPVYEDEQFIPAIMGHFLNVKFDKRNFSDFIKRLYYEILLY